MAFGQHHLNPRGRVPWTKSVQTVFLPESFMLASRAERTSRQTNESNQPIHHKQPFGLRHHEAVFGVGVHVDGSRVKWLLQSNAFAGDRSHRILSVRSQANDNDVRDSLLQCGQLCVPAAVSEAG